MRPVGLHRVEEVESKTDRTIRFKFGSEKAFGEKVHKKKRRIQELGPVLLKCYCKEWSLTIGTWYIPKQ